jgi:hypothetical protein
MGGGCEVRARPSSVVVEAMGVEVESVDHHFHNWLTPINLIGDRDPTEIVALDYGRPRDLVT